MRTMLSFIKLSKLLEDSILYMKLEAVEMKAKFTNYNIERAFIEYFQYIYTNVENSTWKIGNLNWRKISIIQAENLPMIWK